jgi:ribosomal subunit interface protein
VEIVVKGRHAEVSDRFRQTVEDKLSKLEKFDHRIILVDVEVTKEPNPRLAGSAVRIEVTVRARGPVMRAEAAGPDKLTALDKAMAKLEARMRKAADRRRAHRTGHHRRPDSTADGTPASPRPTGTGVDGAQPAGADGATADGAEPATGDGAEPAGADGVGPARFGDVTVIGDGPVVVREKLHRAEPMSIDQALYEMELVGHDFYLFVDEDGHHPSVVYKRRGYTYGVIRLAR